MTAVSFDASFTATEYKLMEVDEPLLEEILRNDGSVCIKGSDEDEAVLCTDTQSFVMRLADSSNMLLLIPGGVPDLKQTKELKIKSQAQEHFELVRCAPRVDRALQMLRQRPFAGEDGAQMQVDEVGEGGHVAGDDGSRPNLPSETDERPTLEMLHRVAQCSPKELREVLTKSRAFETQEGRWCVLEGQYEQDIVECVIALMVEKEWPSSAVPVEECVAELRGQFDAAAVRHCLRCYSMHRNAEWDKWLAAISASTLALDPHAISRFRAEALLKETATWPKDVFIEQWADALPSGIEIDISVDLAGIAVEIEPSGASREARLRALRVQALPTAAAERFASLFALKRSWTLPQLLPYVSDILAPGRTAEQLVLQHSRCVVANNGARTYVTRASG